MVSLTIDDILNMSLDDLYPTNTGHLVSPFGLVRLGQARKDFFVIHDHNGNPLTAGTGNRTANFWQRIALFAKELVCSHPGCTHPANQCEAHHVKPWSDGGETTMDNLTNLCWGHHPDNNGYRKRTSPYGWADTEPETGRTGYRRNHDADIQFNDTTMAKRAAGARIREKYANTASAASGMKGTSGIDGSCGSSAPTLETPPGPTPTPEGLFDVPA